MNFLKQNILYKYRSWREEHHRNLLFSNEVFMSSPKGFNDPFDCRITPDLRSLDTIEKKRTYADRLFVNSYKQIQQSGFNGEDVLNGFTDRLIKNIDQENAFYKEIYTEMQDNHYGIFSLSYRWDIILLWSHYAANHTGFCVGLDRQALEKTDFFGKGGPVMYKTKFPLLDPLSEDHIKNGFIETHTKAKAWEYEKEYRLFKFYKQPPNEDQRKGFLVDDFFKEILIGLYFPKESLEAIATQVESKKIPLYQIEQGRQSFNLKRKRIN
jgi:hypothetical protein